MCVKMMVSFCFMCFAAFSQTAGAQDSISTLADDVNARIRSSGGHASLVVDANFPCEPGAECGPLRREIPKLIGAALRRAVPSFEILEQAALEPYFQPYKLQAIDYYFSAALKPIAQKIGAFYLTGAIKLKRSNAEVTVELYRKDGKRLYKRKIKLPRSGTEVEDEPDICDPRASICLANVGSIGTPRCEWCPNPVFTDEAVAQRIQGVILLLVTVTKDGAATDIAVLKGLGYGLDQNAVEQVRAWRFRPAPSKSGKTVATRVAIEVFFRQFF